MADRVKRSFYLMIGGGERHLRKVSDLFQQREFKIGNIITHKSPEQLLHLSSTDRYNNNCFSIYDIIYTTKEIQYIIKYADYPYRLSDW